MKDRIIRIGKQAIYLLTMFILGYAIIAFMIWDTNVSTWESGERAGAIVATVVLIIIERLCCVINNVVNEDDCVYDDFLTEDEMEMKMKQERYNQKQ